MKPTSELFDRVWIGFADGRHAGSFLRGELGIEAYDVDYNPIGVFSDEDRASDVIFDCWDSRSNGGDPRTASGGRHRAHQDESSPSIASDVGTRTVTVTFFPDKRAQSQRCADLTLPQLAEQIRLETGPSKQKLPWLKLVIFGNTRSRRNCLRTNANAKEITGIEVEHDKGEIAFDTAIATLRTARLRALPYTSPSYAPASKERWRILLPLSGKLVPEMRAMLVARVNGLFGGKLASESFVLSRRTFMAASMATPPTASR